MLLAEPEKYKDAIDAIKKDIAYMPMELKKKLEEEDINLLNETLTTHSTSKPHLRGLRRF